MKCLDHQRRVLLTDLLLALDLERLEDGYQGGGLHGQDQEPERDSAEVDAGLGASAPGSRDRQLPQVFLHHTPGSSQRRPRPAPGHDQVTLKLRFLNYQQHFRVK